MDLPHNRSVLIVDDDPGIRLLLVTFLGRRGFRVLEARNGREALAAMRAGHADLVVMDLMMPEVSGWDVLWERAADPSLQRIPMIVVTANNNRDVTVDLLARNVYAVIGKPFDLDALLTAVTACLDHPHIPILAAA
jgi:CheY-like chemotaxis protein